MKILQVNGYETPGRRFNGLSIAPLLKKHGIDSRHIVWQKDTDNPEVLDFGGKFVYATNKILKKIERLTSLQSMLYTNGSRLIQMPAFQEADLIHLHIIHSGYFSISDLRSISNLKPTVWTLHDPWALTGHCIHPMDCERWKTGCGKCPDLKTQIPLLFDTTRFLFNYKKNVYKKSKLEIIVASKWMKDMVEQSPMFENANIHRIPFGLDLKFYSPFYKDSARKRLNISEDYIVISFRAVNNEYKGLKHILEALELLDTDQKICIIASNGHQQKISKHLSNRFWVIEFDWINDEELMRDIMAASDIFLMPSIAEAFGLMAVEALACGKPIIVFEGTALPEVTFAPDVGIAVPKRNTGALHRAIKQLVDNRTERENRGKQGRVIAEKFYDQSKYVRDLAELYQKLATT